MSVKTRVLPSVTTPSLGSFRLGSKMPTSRLISVPLCTSLEMAVAWGSTENNRVSAETRSVSALCYCADSASFICSPPCHAGTPASRSLNGVVFSISNFSTSFAIILGGLISIVRLVNSFLVLLVFWLVLPGSCLACLSSCCLGFE
jgi:hypothetical protein